MTDVDEVQSRYGRTLFDWQRDPMLDARHHVGETHRSCLFYRTGAGKSVTSLGMVAVMGYDEALVVAPPSTHVDWQVLGERLGVQVEAMSHAKFRMKGTKLSRRKPVIADEFHMFGRNTGSGWMKLERLARGLQAPLIMASATPNYNDAERVYCIKKILDPIGTKGGYLDFLYAECNTKQNNFSMTPDVDDDQPFRRYKNAEEFMAAMPGVYHLPDDLTYTIEDRQVPIKSDPAFEQFGYDAGKQRIMASQIEEKHTRIYNNLVRRDGTRIRAFVRNMLWDLFDEFTNKDSFLIYCTHSKIAEILHQELDRAGYNAALVTGDTKPSLKDDLIRAFKEGQIKMLVGTATLGTGTDGLDRVCNTLIIFDDTEDDAARRQLIGRIMPRGATANTSAGKRVIRFKQ
jgi:hypothetical protein